MIYKAMCEIVFCLVFQSWKRSECGSYKKESTFHNS